MRALLVAVAVLAAGLGGVAAGRFLRRPPDALTYVNLRPGVLEQQAKLAPDGQILIVGDSITERSAVRELCGRPVFNAGVSWAQLHDVGSMARSLVADLRPSAVYLALGTNDARLSGPTPTHEWAGEYEALIRSVAPAPVVIVPIPTMGDGGRRPEYWDPEHARALNTLLPGIARRTGATLIPRPAISTVDGVHPSPAGAAAWRNDLETGCAVVRAAGAAA